MECFFGVRGGCDARPRGMVYSDGVGCGDSIVGMPGIQYVCV